MLMQSGVVGVVGGAYYRTKKVVSKQVTQQC